MKSWKPTPEDNPRPVVVILRSLLSRRGQGGKDVHRMRYKDLFESVRDEFASETTFQVYLNWLVKQGIVKRERKSRKEVWYSVDPGDSYVLLNLSEAMGTLAKKPDKGDVDPTDLVESLASRCVHNLGVAIAEMIEGPVDPVSRKLGPIKVAHLLAEDLALSFKATVKEALYSKNPSRLSDEIVELGRNWEGSRAPAKSPRRQSKKGVSRDATVRH